MVTKSISEWEEIEKNIIHILEICQNDLPYEAVKFVKQYLDHAEYEMAGEGLFIEIMNLENIPPTLHKNECLNLAYSLGLDKEVVYQHDFWVKFYDFCCCKLRS